jgi:hypothetical protein
MVDHMVVSPHVITRMSLFISHFHRPHLGRGRLVPPRPLFHTSIKFRMDKLDYKPRAIYEKGTETYGS